MSQYYESCNQYSENTFKGGKNKVDTRNTTQTEVDIQPSKGYT